MRILIWTSGYYPQWGGVETVTGQLTYRLKERNEIMVFSSLPGAKLPFEEYLDGVKIVRVPHKKRPVKKGTIKDYLPSPRNYLLRKIALFRIISTVNKFAPDVINIHLSRQMLPYVADALPHIHYKRLVLSLHGDEPFIPGKKIVQEEIQIYRNIFPKVDHIVFCSGWLQNIVRSNFNINDNCSSVILNGIDVALFEKTEKLNTNRSPYIFALGRFDEGKGFDLLISAFAEIQINYPDYNLILGGSGSLKSFYEELVKKLNIEGKVHFPGYLDGVEKSAYLKSADLIVVPSRVDALNIVALEAIASGNTVVATNVGGVPEAGGNLVHYAEPTVESIKEKIIEGLKSTPPPRKSITNHLSRFTVERMVSQYEKLFFQTIQESY